MKAHYQGALTLDSYGFPLILNTEHDGEDESNPNTVALIFSPDAPEGGVFGDGGFPANQSVANADRIRDTWNACLGLDLPEGVTPGVLAKLLGAAKGVHDLIGNEAPELDNSPEVVALRLLLFSLVPQ